METLKEMPSVLTGLAKVPIKRDPALCGMIDDIDSALAAKRPAAPPIRAPAAWTAVEVGPSMFSTDLSFDAFIRYWA